MKYKLQPYPEKHTMDQLINDTQAESILVKLVLSRILIANSELVDDILITHSTLQNIPS